MKLIRNILKVLFFSIASLKPGLTAQEQQKFLQSFIKTYEFNASGRYAHEYHPFILSRTAKSMHRLEEVLAKNGIKFAGRYVLMGYEANAFERFLPRLSDCEGRIIDDEACIKDAFRGWALKLHNKFGATTGFLFRQISRALPDLEVPFQHVNPDSVEIYGLGLNLLQELTFGKIWPALVNLEWRILKAIENKQWKEALAIVIGFWERLYAGEITIDTQGQGTQDVLFAIENAKFITSSNVELLKFYTGPDITYPISTSKLCTGLATKNAQAFLKVFIKELKPRESQNTLYIFRSFVDGVGKSTLLGNITNYLKHGSDVEKYESVDNTSSLDFDLFQFSDPENPFTTPGKVFIADMPAQMSHFVFKPEGKVYVDVQALSRDGSVWAETMEYFLQNKVDLQSAFSKLYQEVVLTKDQGKIPVQWCFDGSNPARAYAANLVLLKDSCPMQWIPFEHNGQNFLVKNSGSVKELRILLDIKDARSEGLKNASAAQMIFTSGISFPASYELFLENFVKKISDRGITNVAFVDFISMYSRSSRENVRINYVVQAIAHIDNALDVQRSTYKHFVSDTEFLYILEQPSICKDLTKFLTTESILRLLLCDIMSDNKFEKQTTIDCVTIQALVEKGIFALTEETLECANLLCQQKVNAERALLRSLHGNSREFLNVYSLDFDKLKDFSDFVVQLFESKVSNQGLNTLWENCSAEVLRSDIAIELNSLCKKFDGPEGQDYVTLSNGQKMRVLAYFSPHTRDPFIMDKVVKTMRVGWTFALLNLFAFSNFDPASGSLTVPFETIPQLPFVLKKDDKGNFLLLEKDFDQAEVLSEFMPDGSNDYYGLKINGVQYLFDYYFKNTEYGFLGLGYLTASMEYYYFSSTYMQNYTLETFFKDGANKKNAMSFAKVWQEIASNVFPSLNYSVSRTKEALKNPSINDWLASLRTNIDKLSGQIDKFGYSDLQCSVGSYDFETNKEQQIKKIVLSQDGNGPALIDGFNFVSSIFATMHFLIRDPQSVMAPITNTQPEFQAIANLFRYTVAPEYLGVILANNFSGQESQLVPCIPINFDF